MGNDNGRGRHYTVGKYSWIKILSSFGNTIYHHYKLFQILILNLTLLFCVLFSYHLFLLILVSLTKLNLHYLSNGSFLVIFVEIYILDIFY